MTNTPPPPEHDTEDAEVDKQAANHASVSKKAKKVWSKPTIVRSSDGMTLFESGTVSADPNETAHYYVTSV